MMRTTMKICMTNGLYKSLSDPEYQKHVYCMFNEDEADVICALCFRVHCLSRHSLALVINSPNHWAIGDPQTVFCYDKVRVSKEVVKYTRVQRLLCHHPHSVYVSNLVPGVKQLSRYTPRAGRQRFYFPLPFNPPVPVSRPASVIDTPFRVYSIMPMTN
ncbi:hypothetical protein M378DRAFT_873251 [Amanita muscaria Koide BX008]|uniref:Uncharacterized protein n=1 Tax=Amanita muscaria (strain Koide BX008) TaxID=946122 RepID=A0A0C2WX71_AMAMK|nr:hypothetical protein M378DRAFT_873251 [Amanita muscaria Koide BX008]